MWCTLKAKNIINFKCCSCVKFCAGTLCHWETLCDMYMMRQESNQMDHPCKEGEGEGWCCFLPLRLQLLKRLLSLTTFH